MGKIVGLTFDEKPAKGGKKGAKGEKPAEDKKAENGGANDAEQTETPPESAGG